MKCQSIIGSGQFVGFPEFVPSVPPLFFLESDLSGGWSWTCSANGEGCTGPFPNQFSITFGGSCIYSATTGLLIQNSGQCVATGGCGITQIGGVCDVSQSFGDACEGVGLNLTDLYEGDNYHGIVQPLVPGAGTCRTSGSGFNGCLLPSSSAACLRKNPDTIENAIARALGPNPVWGGADTACADNTSYTTLWNNTGIFTFSAAQVQVTIPLAQAGHTYEITVTLVERATGSGGVYTPYGLMQFNVSASVSGPAVSPWQTLPVDAGLQIMASSCSVVDLGT